MASETAPAQNGSAKDTNVIELNVEKTWARMRVEASAAAAQEPILASFLNATILHHNSYTAALSYRLSQKVADREMNAMLWREVCDEAFSAEPAIVTAALADIHAVYERDPACRELMQPFLYFKGYQAIQLQRISSWLWRNDREALALFLQSRMSELFSIDIHPAARLGQGLFLDHAHNVVIGETAVVGDDVSMLHGVTLGGTGKESADRHPKIGNGVLIGSGAKVLGNIQVGDNAKIASGSVVLEEVPAGCTVAGIPAKVVGKCPDQEPAKEMKHGLWVI
ncbi:serine O-acetyltransferase [Parvularcula sp. IMCC14364]|uniref:serine O-acetyltransferase n=1 Tax=Parvularcula sp. IMCC14364 TaxID=3067902 RepID=UPI0027421D97|nr:serine O-acetyltransferase [Parvularcula sp. IMCC14364]